MFIFPKKKRESRSISMDDGKSGFR